jgi:hypothetical protein
VSTSYIQQVADKEIIETVLKNSMIKYYDILKNVIDVVEGCEGYQPWAPFSNLVSEWKATKSYIRKPTA